MSARKKTVIFWQRDPYDAFVGGDGLYIDQLKKFMHSVGWDIVTITSNYRRPRISFRLKYCNSKFRSITRGAYFLDGRYYLLPHAILISLCNYFSRSQKGWSAGLLYKKLEDWEMTWTKNVLRSLTPALVIKCFDIGGALDFQSAFAGDRLHLIGFLNHDEYKIRNNIQVSEHSSSDFSKREKELISDDVQSGHFGLGFSSHYDRNRVAQSSVHVKALFVGIGFESRFKSHSVESGIMLFVGNKTLPNHQSITYFLKHILPLIAMRKPNVRLRIVGRVCSYLDHGHKNVELVGEVDDLAEEYNNAMVIVAPLVTGSAGVKTKVAESFRYGRVVVTTSLGVDPSLPHQFDGAALIADSPEDFASAILSLLDDEHYRHTMEAQCERIFNENFSFHYAYAELLEWLNQLDSAD